MREGGEDKKALMEKKWWRAENWKKRHNGRINGGNAESLWVGEMRKMGERIKAMRKTDLLMQIPCILIWAENAPCFAQCCASPSNFLPLITVKAKQIKSLRRMDHLLYLWRMEKETEASRRAARSVTWPNNCCSRSDTMPVITGIPRAL